ncbi:PfkB family carbohydrate kinase [Mucilaginibacter myungsuensis]|uniref:Ribokinase n=1 Tax=Mucilaginibacter myungsuensis TaxID=649104 RepID=A0A929PV45_9SPHI|nr:PfkB family carbohydrate kinase [Mucilaginibacter myungsuensis]MBE9661428.1 ribokinase [Mucilaginibacter myungsuensis]MDN3597571.1 PfkB family carbohydrate kinase [Mucilaginibacter myungsuensis]
MYDICCIGHITSDKVVTTRSELYMPGGTAYYFSCAVSKLPLQYLLATAIAPAEMHYVKQLEDMGTTVKVQESQHTVFFENIYGENQDDRTQNVLETADQFAIPQFDAVDAQYFHLGPLLAGDISTELIQTLATKGKVSLDVQGYLRQVIDHKVYPAQWDEKQQALQYVDIVKADIAELRTLSGKDTVAEGAELLAKWGVKEIVITNGSQGSQIYADGIWFDIPAYAPNEVVDATGCGDTYMAGYLYQRQKGASIPDAGNFAAAMAGLKTAKPGAFTGTEDDVLTFMRAKD